MGLLSPLLSFIVLLVGASAQAGLCTWCPRVVPTWEPTWAMAESTIVQPCNSSGLLSAESLAGYSIVSVDWSNSKDVWVQGHPMDAETPLVQQAALLHAANAKQRVWIYRNLVIGYPWFPSVREKLMDPAYADWFIRFGPPPFANGSYHVPQCDDNYDPPLCTNFYHSQDQTPNYPKGDGSCDAPCDCGGVPCGFYLFNHANASLRTWLIDDFVFGPTGLGAPGISGLYLDDHFSNVTDSTDAPDCASSPIGGPTEVNSGCIADTGLVQADTTANTEGWRAMMLQLQQRLLDAGAFSWAFFTQFSNGAPSQPTCLSFFRNNGTELYSLALMMGLAKNATGSLERDLATFLLVRGPYAWLGHGWQGCVGAPGQLPSELFLDYGVPVNNLTERADEPGVFERNWTHASVLFNCSSWQGQINMIP